LQHLKDGTRRRFTTGLGSALNQSLQIEKYGAKMDASINFPAILEKLKTIYTSGALREGCPDIQHLIDLVYGDLDIGTKREITPHIEKCTACGVAMLKISANRAEWELEMAASPDDALSRALGSQGRKTVERLIASPSPMAVVSRIKNPIATWVSRLWTPMWAGQALTAADLPEQHHYFDMGDGEYVKLRCSWEGEQIQHHPRIEISWSANIYTSSKIWIQFVDPDTNDELHKVLLGTDLEGSLAITAPQLTFDPSTRGWGVKILIEPEE
jgi:hypothetical protein